jgi:formylglycine-generating enzyme required for sulfatase activity
MSKPDELDPAKVNLPDFSIGRYEITNAQYAAFARAPGNDIGEPGNGDRFPPGMDRHPVVNISWYDAVRYTQWLSDLTDKPYRLCTEAEWEKACRGTSGRLYPWGDAFDDDFLNFEGKPTTPVGEFSPQGDSFYGVADMAGNVFEWTSTLRSSYPYNKDDGREAVFEPGERVQRGGFYDLPADSARCAARFSNLPDNRFNNLGFRVCMSPGP